ncbi:MAG TPA: diguanylate cyclase [Acidimicrobiales bacterium]|nr:diguanylate cyclase [Acidimicrobiales bacterium]
MRLAMLVIAAVLPAGVLVGQQAAAWRAAAERDAAAEVARLAESAALQQEHLVASTTLLLQALSSTTQVADRSRCAVELARIHDELPQFGVLGVADATGALWCSSRQTDGAVSVADRDYFAAVRATSAPSFGRYQIGRVSGKPTVALAHPLIDSNGDFAGAVIASIDLSRPAMLAERFELPEGSTVTVYDDVGTVLMRWPDPNGFVGQQTPFQLRSHQSGNTVRLAGLDGVERFYGVAEIASGGDLTLTVGVPSAAVFSAATERLRSTWRWLAVIVLAGALAAIGAGHALVVRPVRHLQETVKRLSAGDLTARASLDRTGGELGELAEEFDTMAVALQLREVELRRAEQRAVEERYLGLLDVSADAVIVTSADGSIAVFNRGAEEMFGIPSSEAVGVPVNQVIGSDVDLSDRSDLHWTDATGAARCAEATASPGEDGRATLILRDVTSDREQQAELEVKALHDPLTGLANRSLLFDRLQMMLNQRHRTGIVVAFLDLDAFKVVNDTLGHATGDALLVEISRNLQTTRRAGDVVARLGGDEFVIAGEATDRAAAMHLGKRIVAAVANSTIAGADAVSVSVGLAWIGPDDPSDAPAAIATADAALLSAKRARRGAIVLAAAPQTAPRRPQP